MRHDFFPDREADMLTWSANFRAKLSADPQRYGISPEIAQEYALLQERFAQAYGYAAGGVRGPAATTAKNDARDAMEKASRRLARLIACAADPSAEVRIQLGINVRKPRVRELGAPTSAPVVIVRSVSVRRVKISLRDPEREGSRARPDIAAGATFFTHLGEAWPAEMDAWSLCRHTSKTDLSIDLPHNLPAFSQVWIRARWFGTRCEPGALSYPVSIYLGHGISRPVKAFTGAA